MKTVLTCLAVLAAMVPLHVVADTGASIDYAVHGAAFSATITYCHAKYGVVSKASPGGNCFLRAKTALMAIDLKSAATRVKQQCGDASTLDRCITPQLSDIVNSILRLFDAKKV